MYLSVSQCDQLDMAVKSFEVAFRSYVANRIVSELNTEAVFCSKIAELDNSIEQSSIILSGKMKSLLKKIIRNSSCFYSNLEYANNCFLSGQESTDPHDVSYLSEIIGLSYLFATTYFSDLLVFKTKEEFLLLSVTYYNVRNALSHRGSELIMYDDLLYSTYFMSEINNVIYDLNPNYFWYKSRTDIDKTISKLLAKESIPIKVNNLSEIAFSEKKFVCRESELSELKKLTYPNQQFLKKPTSICIYGYGGVGKTSLVHEYIKLLIKDINDSNLDNEYFQFILFFTAKDEELSYNKLSGDIEIHELDKQFSSYDELKNLIYSSLSIDDFASLSKHGIIILDNIESINDEHEHEKINNLIQYESPANIQYIITSRKPEDADKKLPLNSFDSISGKLFIDKYINENDLHVILTDQQIDKLLDLSRGNALVLVLALNRLDSNLISFDTISTEFRDRSYQIIENELESVPPTAFEMISDFMYRNTIQDIENKYSNKTDYIFTILKSLAVYDSSLDEYTLCLLTDIKLDKLREILRILLKYLILEKNNDSYIINEFANKYILERFLPNSIERNDLYMKVTSNVRNIKKELQELDKKAEQSPDLKKILNDWMADSYGDKIAISKAYSLYSNLLYTLKYEGGTIRDESIQQYINEFNSISRVTIHPYVDFQKAAALSKIELEFRTTQYQKQIKRAYEQCISTTRYNYQHIKNTYSFAIVLWKYGQYLVQNIHDNLTGSR